jgi:hypothetical protein
LFHCDIAVEYSNCETRLSYGNPYTAVGDFNGDNVTDFAALLETEPGAGPNAIIVFNGPFAGSPKMPSFIQLGLEATDVLEVIQEVREVVLTAGPPGNGARLWPLSNGSYTFEHQGELIDDDAEYVLDQLVAPKSILP